MGGLTGLPRALSGGWQGQWNVYSACASIRCARLQLSLIEIHVLQIKFTPGTGLLARNSIWQIHSGSQRLSRHEYLTRFKCRKAHKNSINTLMKHMAVEGHTQSQ